MASSFSLTSSSYEGRYLQLSCSQTKDISANRSTINWTLSSINGSSDYTVGPTNVHINGTHVYTCARMAWSSKAFPAAKGSVSGSITVDHDQYGDASISVSFSTAIYYGTVQTYSGTWTLDNIPRASQPSCITWPDTTKDVGYMGNTITIHTNRVSSSFTHTVESYWYDHGATIATGVANNVQWTIPMDYCRDIPTLSVSWGFIRVHTYNGGTYIGYKDVNFDAHVPNYTLSPPIAATATLNSEFVSPAAQTWGVGIKGKTKINWSITPPESQYYNYIKKYYLTLIREQDTLTVPGTDVLRLAETNASSGTTAVINNIGTFCLKASIQDSRDKISDYILRDPNDSTKPLKITVYDYDIPKIQSATALRCDEEGVPTDNGAHLLVSCLGLIGSDVGGRNSITALYQKRVIGGEYSAAEAIPTNPISGLSLVQAYEVKFTIKDTIGSETTNVISVPLGKTDFNLTPHGAGFGTYHDASKPNTIQSAWDIYIKGDMISDFVVDTIEHRETGYGFYGRKWASGYAEYWVSKEYTHFPNNTSYFASAYYCDLNPYCTFPTGWNLKMPNVAIPSIAGGELLTMMVDSFTNDGDETNGIKLRVYCPVTNIPGYVGSWWVYCYIQGLWK